MLVGQQYLADPARSAGDVHPVWAYAHVPTATTATRPRPCSTRSSASPPACASASSAAPSARPPSSRPYNPNYVGGDIATGANTPLQLLFRPRLALDPYSTGVPGVYLCSAATPPGGGVHGMCGYNAARSALRYLGRG